MRPLLLLLAASVLSPLKGGHVTEGDPRNSVVIPEQTIALPFDHEAHLGGAGLGCTDCHTEITTSKRAKDYNIPTREMCIECHDAIEVPWSWAEKPGKRDNAVIIPPANLRFSHESHLALEGVDCAVCHAGVEKAKLATTEHLPSMETCLTCHDGRQASSDCATCHIPGRAGTIRTAFAAGQLMPDDHDASWLRAHEPNAERDLAYCASCHGQDDCLSCHEGSVRPTFHEGNYLSEHPRDAFANNPVCSSCHRLERFCKDCHFRAGVNIESPRQGFGLFHHPDWASFDVGPNHHSRMAKKNMTACAACHEGTSCKTCHQWYDGAPRTHGRGWANSDRMRRLRRENPSLCLTCHSLADPSDPYNR